MIRIIRTPAPAFLTDKDGKWHLETQAAIKFYAEGGTGSYDFQHYNDPKLKAALKEIFVKCAYCETIYDANSDGDVEHFRPKGKVKEKTPQTPGYYWLANNWDNLLLSCMHCNQNRKHILYGENHLAAYGKMDQFPLKPQGNWLSSPDEVPETEEEFRLLLNPCIDDPREHFAYDENHALLLPLTDKAEASIKIYVLHRPNLVRQRKKILLRLLQQVSLVKMLLELSNENPDNKKMAAAFGEAFDIMMNYTSTDAPYAGMCRFFVGRFIRENNLQ